MTFLRAATPAQRKRLATLSRTSVANLYQVAGNYRKASAGLAIRLDRASRRMPASLPRLDRKAISPDCAGCEFVRQCSK